MEKGREFAIQRLKENRKTALANLAKQMNIISPLLADFENEKHVPTEAVQFHELFVKMQEAHHLDLRALDDDGEIKLALQWYNSRDKVCVSY